MPSYTDTMWNEMYRSPEFNLRSRAASREKKASEFQMGMAQEQWDFQKAMYGQQQAQSKEAAAGLTGMIGQYNQAYGEAKSANEARYQQMLGTFDQATGQQAADIRSDAFGKKQDIGQRLARLGLSNTSRGTTMGMGVDREMRAELNRSQDAQLGAKRGVIERKEDEYPRSDMILGLVQALSQGGAGGGASNILGALTGMRQG